MIVVGGEALVDLVDERGVLRPIPGGGPFNTAIALGRLGVPVAYLGTLSHDEYGSLLAGSLVEAGVDMSLVRSSDAPTPLAVRMGTLLKAMDRWARDNLPLAVAAPSNRAKPKRPATAGSSSCRGPRARLGSSGPSAPPNGPVFYYPKF